MAEIQDCLTGDGWEALRDRISGGADLEEWARRSGALSRIRRIRDGASLLRLALAYGACGMSLRQCSLWAASQGLADVSNVALLKRLRRSADWLEEIAASLLCGGPTSRPVLARTVPAPPSSGRLCLIDGTTISAPGAGKPSWRLVVSFDVERQRAVGLRLTPAEEGEHLDPATVAPDDLVIADRGFARPHEVGQVAAKAGHFLVRLGSRSLRLQDEAGQPLPRAALLAQAAEQGGLDRPVWIGHSRTGGWTPLPARLIMLPLPDDMATANRRKLDRAGQREGYRPSATAYLATRWVMLITSLPAEQVPAEAIGALYRLRWQVELYFKRLKSLAHLDQLPAKDPDLARTWLYANLIATLIVEDLASEILDAPPSAPSSQTAERLPLAPLG